MTTRSRCLVAVLVANRAAARDITMALIATSTIFLDADRPSRVVLPILG